MNIHFLQHVPFETPGYISALAKKYNCSSTCTTLFDNDEFPNQDNFELLIVLGGPMNVYEEQQFPFLTKEKKFIENSIRSGKKVVGICLGAQLIATVLGASVVKNHTKEIGWFPVQLKNGFTYYDILKELPREFTPLHWHGDTFEIPNGAFHFASSDACKNQGFIYDNRIIGLQFHLEATPESLQSLITHCSEELVEGRYIQNETQLYSEAMKYLNPANMILENFFKALIGNQIDGGK